MFITDDNTFLAKAGPGTPKSSAKRASHSTTEKYPGLGLGYSTEAHKRRRLRAPAWTFAGCSKHLPASPHETPEAGSTSISSSASTSYSESETETYSVSSITSNSAPESVTACGDDGRTPRLYRLIYGDRRRACSPPAEPKSPANSGGDEGNGCMPRESFSAEETGTGAHWTCTAISGDLLHTWAGDERAETTFDPFSSSLEDAYYHLPSQLLSPELEMSSAEFVATVAGWTQRRREACL